MRWLSANFTITHGLYCFGLFLGFLALEVSLAVALALLPVLLRRLLFAELRVVVLQHLLFVVVERHEVEVQVLDAVVFQDVLLRLQQLTQVQVVQDACLCQGEVLVAVVEGAGVLVNALGANTRVNLVHMLAHVKRLLIGCA